MKLRQKKKKTYGWDSEICTFRTGGQGSTCLKPSLHFRYGTVKLRSTPGKKRINFKIKYNRDIS